MERIAFLAAMLFLVGMAVGTSIVRYDCAAGRVIPHEDHDYRCVKIPDGPAMEFHE